jgi:hypothetical protein
VSTVDSGRVPGWLARYQARTSQTADHRAPWWSNLRRLTVPAVSIPTYLWDTLVHMAGAITSSWTEPAEHSRYANRVTWLDPT